jgi:phage tail-like protein
MPTISSLKNETLPSKYLQYLPSVFQDDEFMGQFLRIFESIFTPIENTVGSIDYYFDPLITTGPMIAWLESWVDMDLASEWPEQKRRQLISSAVDLYRWRGTKRGLSTFLKIYTGVIPDIIEYIPGMVLGEKTRLGVNSLLGSSSGGHHFSVIIRLEKGSAVDINTVKKIIETQKPAHAAYDLQVVGGD